VTKPIVILGAGPAGMASAWRLSQLGKPVVVLERDGAVGGMGRTTQVDDYAVDFGPHTFHIRETDESRRVIQAIRPLFGPDPLILTRGTRVQLRGKYYVYPLELTQVLLGVNPLLSLRIVADYVLATMKSLLAPARTEHSFEEWGVRNLGRTLYELCFGLYSERVWGMPTSQISSKQAQRVAKLNLKNVILRTLGLKADPTTYFTKYMYPRRGISVLFDGMADAVRQAGGEIRLNTPAVRIERDGDVVKRVVCLENGRETAIECEGVISTLPLPALVKATSPALPGDLAAHAARLKYRSLKLIYVVLKRAQMTDFHWVYLLDRHYRVNRISEQKNVSAEMAPPDRTVLCIELSCWRDEPLWTAPDEEIYRLALTDLMKTGFGVTEADVERYWVYGIETAYPVYELNFEDHLIPVLEGVHQLKNLHTIGRHGLFLNNSMDDNVLLGTQIGDTIAAHGFQSDLWLTRMLAFMNLRFQGK
jgi:protoporphyrinogen oxidase